jgi:hypothetical protein
MVLINPTDYPRWVSENFDYFMSDYPIGLGNFMIEYPSMELVNGSDMGYGFRLNEVEATIFALKWS